MPLGYLLEWGSRTENQNLPPYSLPLNFVELNQWQYLSNCSLLTQFLRLPVTLDSHLHT